MAVGDSWTQIELEAAVRAYLEMLSLERSGKAYSKAEYRRNLRASVLAARSDGSIEFRMQNISASLEELCLPWISGYKPAANIGNNVKDQINALLFAAGVVEPESVSPTAEAEELRERTGALRERLGSTLLRGRPRGQVDPQRVSSASTRFIRDPLVRAWVLEAAGGNCEACAQPAPFLDSSGRPYLEVHHVLTLAEGGPDTIDNTVAVCPNCHRQLHLGDNRLELRRMLWGRVDRLKPL